MRLLRSGNPHLNSRPDSLNLPWAIQRTYTFDTFPNPDTEVGEWIQIRDRQGRPQNKVVALPVKDPFHVMRALILIVDLLDQHSLRLES